MPFVNLTRATLRRAEFGFFGVVVYTLMHTPRRCGDRISAGLLVFPLVSFRACLINWLIVGIPSPLWTVQSVLLQTFGFYRFLGGLSRPNRPFVRLRRRTPLSFRFCHQRWQRAGTRLGWRG